LSEAVICLPIPGSLQEFSKLFMDMSDPSSPKEYVYSFSYPALQLQPQICTGTNKPVKCSKRLPE